jgi:C4-dicarboxylate-specific signal transduction histidine kinase
MIRRAIIARPATLSITLVLFVFSVDLCLPLGVASAVPYTFAVLLALSAKPKWFGPCIAGLCMVLTIAKMGIVPERGTTEMWKVIVNRCLALFSISMTLLLGLLRRKAAEERARAEELLRQHQADLAHMGRLTMLGQVAAALAHELNQPLAAVCLQADLAARIAVPGQPLSSEFHTILSEIADQSRRAAEIVASIRRMARRAAPGCDFVDVNDAARVVAKLLDWHASRAGVTIELKTHADPSIFAVGDRIQIEQVLFNLVQNGIDAITRGGQGPRIVTLETRNEAEMLLLVVKDAGIGLSQPEAAFDRFYTTKPDGMGLGLAISRSIVEAHGGRIWAEAGEGGGAVFSVALPAARREES